MPGHSLGLEQPLELLLVEVLLLLVEAPLELVLELLLTALELLLVEAPLPEDEAVDDAPAPPAPPLPTRLGS